MNSIISIIQDRLRLAQDRQSKYVDKKRINKQFNIGDKVLLNTHLACPEDDHKRATKKLKAKFMGPFTIQEIISPTTYKLDLPSNLRIHPVVNIEWLKKYNENKIEGRNKPPIPLIETVEGTIEYEVERILDMRQVRKGRRQIRQFLVKWKGYPEYESTWEPEDNLNNAKEAIEDYLKQVTDDEDVVHLEGR
jgi:hypothetical protein